MKCRFGVFIDGIAQSSVGRSVHFMLALALVATGQLPEPEHVSVFGGDGRLR